MHAKAYRDAEAWKIKSQFSRSDDLIFPNREGQHLGHDNFIKRQFPPLFDLLPTVKRFNWRALRHFAVSCWIEAGLAPKTVQARWPCVAASRDGSIRALIPERRSPEGDGPDCQGTILGARRTLGELPCAIRVTWTRRYKATQDGKGLISLGFDNIAHRCEVRLNSAHAKAR